MKMTIAFVAALVFLSQSRAADLDWSFGTRLTALEKRVGDLDSKTDRILAKLDGAPTAVTPTPAKPKNVLANGTWYTDHPDGTRTICRECNQSGIVASASASCPCVASQGYCPCATTQAMSVAPVSYQTTGFTAGNCASGNCGAATYGPSYSSPRYGSSFGGACGSASGDRPRLFGRLRGMFGCGG